ncbi:tRNA (N(6)-L-threonylcarbamoyladenosine(37)-C(2))-methylthiotransferase MtaB [Natranaerobius trueperi]|uniref:Threonylcarbamoyladenosine tRNA methylthiotransferase MtaB n=1 Tax=Natranaerobius trueperi TaxID=759412 RepID=A0A226BW34_9FIRM|nr:tRNA (N(6)-L-threonylcarbamoyladenosine(37)-C(2))-methylthiotransferase MtaB [Natranaerobius trueperi]OWZ83121.1 tRNA (N(6)-L-threonylcarbamoyladenosine(37)-C(2))-methylthiotransferase MtaB [Natranaerobius trueperi]
MTALKVTFVTLGCKVNQYDTEAIKDQFFKKGFEIVTDQNSADVFVINTCTVTNLADKKSRQYIRRVKRNNPESVVAAIGCYVQANPEKVKEIQDIDIVLGTDNRKSLVKMVEDVLANKTGKKLELLAPTRKREGFEELSITSFKEIKRSRHFLKVQEGCDRFCSYCIVPYARGELRSRAPKEVIKEVERAIEAGFKEIVLTGINLGAYGRETSEYPDLSGLVETIIGIDKEFRIRLSSCEPQEITPELIDLVTESSKVCSHLHIPLQNGDDEILSKMNRSYTTDDYYNLITDIKKKNPLIALSTDVMVGFPGEKEYHFENTKDFLDKVGFSSLHVFQYSPRKYTKAAKLNEQVQNKVKKQRSDSLIKISKQLSKRYQRNFVGEVVDVLVERVERDYSEGLSGNYLNVKFPTTNNISEREFIKVLIDCVDDDYVYGLAQVNK